MRDGYLLTKFQEAVEFRRSPPDYLTLEKLNLGVHLEINAFSG